MRSVEAWSNTVALQFTRSAKENTAAVLICCFVGIRLCVVGSFMRALLASPKQQERFASSRLSDLVRGNVTQYRRAV